MAASFELNDDSVVVVIGSGAGGGTLANELAQKGVKVVCLEAGVQNDIPDFINDEWESFAQLSWGDKRTTSGSWRVAKDFPNLPAWTVKSVGGTTVHWAGASLRIQEHEFKALSTYGKVAGANLLDWPITADELDPWYAKAEFKLGTTGTNGIPRLPGNNNYKIMAHGAKQLGYKDFHTGNMSINSQPRDGRGSCQQISSRRRRRSCSSRPWLGISQSAPRWRATSLDGSMAASCHSSMRSPGSSLTVAWVRPNASGWAWWACAHRFGSASRRAAMVSMLKVER